MTNDKSGNAMAIDHLDRLSNDLAGIRSDADHVLRLATVGTMAAGLVHEVNNLLTPALAYLQLAQGNQGDADLVRKAIDKAIAGIESATRISEALLGFSSDTAEPDTSNLREIIDATVDCLPRDPAKDGVDLTIDVPSQASVAIAPHALQHVFLNLVLNACEALRGNGGTVSIAAIPSAKATLTITVTDSGPGIPSEVAGRIFEPFVSTSADPDDNEGHHGSGLGLVVCKHLVEQAGGSITASSGGAGKGTTFTIELPAVRQQARAKAS